jgi:predicted DNA-binding WGR domain protein
VLLTRVDASRNMRRFYGLGLVRSLWGEVGLARQWGRIGSQGQRRTDWHESAGSAAAELQRLAQTKQRKGYR